MKSPTVYWLFGIAAALLLFGLVRYTCPIQDARNAAWDAVSRIPLSEGAERHMIVEVYRGTAPHSKFENPLIIEPYANDEHTGVCFKYNSGWMDCFYAEDVSEY